MTAESTHSTASTFSTSSTEAREATGRPHPALACFLPSEEADAVTHSLCQGCGLCSMVCLSHALSMEGLRPVSHYYQRAPVYNAPLCQHCGRCAAVCPSNTLYQPSFANLLQRVQKESVHTMVFFCRQLQSSMPSILDSGHVPPAMSLVEASMSPPLQRLRVPEGVLFELVRCSGRVGARLMDRLVRSGVRRLLIFACPAQACTYHQTVSLIDTQCQGLSSVYAAYGVDALLRVLHEVPKSVQQVEDDIAHFALEDPAAAHNPYSPAAPL